MMTISSTRKALGLTRVSQTVVLSPEDNAMLLAQMEEQTHFCQRALAYLKDNPDVPHKTLRQKILQEIYDTGKENSLPFRALFNELYHVHKRFAMGLQADKGIRTHTYMTFYTKDFCQKELYYDPETGVLSIDVTTLKLSFVLDAPLPDTVKLPREDDGSCFVNIAVSKITGTVTLDIFY